MQRQPGNVEFQRGFTCLFRDDSQHRAIRDNLINDEVGSPVVAFAFVTNAVVSSRRYLNPEAL